MFVRTSPFPEPHGSQTPFPGFFPGGEHKDLFLADMTPKINPIPLRIYILYRILPLNLAVPGSHCWLIEFGGNDVAGFLRFDCKKLCKLCLVLLECLLFSELSLLEPSYHGHVLVLWLMAPLGLPTDSQRHLAAMWVHHLGYPAQPHHLNGQYRQINFDSAIIYNCYCMRDLKQGLPHRAVYHCLCHSTHRILRINYRVLSHCV